jgi:hypothetical protein
LETSRAQLSEAEAEQERDRQELHIHQEKLKDMEFGGSKRPQSIVGKTTLNDELGMIVEGETGLGDSAAE